MIEHRKDRVEMHRDIVHLPAEFREVARLANRAGLDGLEVADVECGLDPEAIRAIGTAADDVAKLGTADLPWPKSLVTITYRPEGNPNIRIEATDERSFHCFRLTLNAKAGADDPDRAPIEIMLHARDLVDLIHKASSALCDWQKQSTDYLIQKITEARL